MASSNLRFFCLLLFFLLAGSTSSATTFISDNVFESHESTGRTLLQAKKGCPVNFETLNYTIVTTKCKGPRYDSKLCCGAFKELACPYTEELNDLTNNCATTLFSYLNLYGKYPPGLFASECREGKEGLLCTGDQPGPTPGQSSAGRAGVHMLFYTRFPLLMLTVGVLVLPLF